MQQPLETARRFREQDLEIYGGSSYETGYLGEINFPSSGFLSDTGVFIAQYYRVQRPNPFQGRTAAVRVDQVKRRIMKGYPEVRPRTWVRASRCFGTRRSPLRVASSSSTATGRRTRARGLLERSSRRGSRPAQLTREPFRLPSLWPGTAAANPHADGSGASAPICFAPHAFTMA